METRDKQFREIMKSYRPEKAPVDFTKMVMEEVHRHPVLGAAYEPVFGKWFLRLLGALFAAFIAYASFSTAPGSADAEPSRINSLFSGVPKPDLTGLSAAGENVAGWFGQVPSVVFFALIAATLLLGFDWLLQRRHQRS
ncbi:hypothetical protein [Gaoshiqia sediminis]|uniref:Uncharacterized protein n=1 Tax=Gaoshiqia sediminis TaxID=2986998 RepID=A0AA41Y1V0_9BACT|nr:hypothetical protein [Gaoshiqia sediminis]MCW0481926.1 hypothetical protein [Gaoshiqia sediminis]